MMATTHALVGIAIATGLGAVFPSVTVMGVIAAAAGGLFPDLDLYAGHRRTLHYPVYFSILGVVAVVVAALVGSPLLWALSLFVIAAAAHSVMDAAGGGLELRPWRGNSDRAVYSHYHRKWIRPRRWIRYDGAPEDLALGGLAAIPGLMAFDGRVALGLYGLLALSVGYVLVRKPMVAVAEWLFERAPRQITDLLPERFLEDSA